MRTEEGGKGSSRYRPRLATRAGTVPAKGAVRACRGYHGNRYGECIMSNSLVKTICYGLALAMGVAVIVLNIIAPLAPASMGTLLAIGLAALGLAGLQN